jgi:hypothetical protein
MRIQRGDLESLTLSQLNILFKDSLATQDRQVLDKIYMLFGGSTLTSKQLPAIIFYEAIRDIKLQTGIDLLNTPENIAITIQEAVHRNLLASTARLYQPNGVRVASILEDNDPTIPNEYLKIKDQVIRIIRNTPAMDLYILQQLSQEQNKSSLQYVERVGRYLTNYFTHASYVYKCITAGANNISKDQRWKDLVAKGFTKDNTLESIETMIRIFSLAEGLNLRDDQIEKKAMLLKQIVGTDKTMPVQARFKLWMRSHTKIWSSVHSAISTMVAHATPMPEDICLLVADYEVPQEIQRPGAIITNIISKLASANSLASVFEEKV